VAETGAVCEEDNLPSSYGLGPFDAVDMGSPLWDDGETVLSVFGEIDQVQDHHWYVVKTEDSVVADKVAGRNAYNFQLKLEQGAEVYRFTVYRNDYIPSAAECPRDYDTTEYSDYYLDTEHVGLTDPQACAGPQVMGRNECEDMGATYYIEVFRTEPLGDCGVYQLSAVNGDMALVSPPATTD
jgi:hypothetical protein